MFSLLRPLSPDVDYHHLAPSSPTIFDQQPPVTSPSSSPRALQSSTSANQMNGCCALRCCPVTMPPPTPRLTCLSPSHLALVALTANVTAFAYNMHQTPSPLLLQSDPTGGLGRPSMGPSPDPCWPNLNLDQQPYWHAGMRNLIFL